VSRRHGGTVEGTAAMKRFTNAQAFAQYRQQLPTLLNGRDNGFFAQILDDDMRILMTVGVWAARNSARGSAIAGRLADTAALIARNRACDAAELVGPRAGRPPCCSRSRRPWW
jgi:hypothetical protein